MAAYIVFYGTQVYAEYDTHREMRADLYPHTEVQNDVYNGGYIYVVSERDWYRCDETPVLLEDVPKFLRTLVLLMGI